MVHGLVHLDQKEKDAVAPSCFKIFLYSLANISHTLYINPCSTLPIPSSTLIMPNLQLEEHQLKLIERKSFRDVLNLSKNWPDG